MKRVIRANYNKQSTLNFVLDENDRERYIHTLIGEIEGILASNSIRVSISDIDYKLMIDIIGSSNRDVIDTIIVPYESIIYDWDDVYYAANNIADKVLEEARI